MASARNALAIDLLKVICDSLPDDDRMGIRIERIGLGLYLSAVVVTVSIGIGIVWIGADCIFCAKRQPVTIIV